MTDDGKITCHIDGARVHTISGHIKRLHPDWTIDRYKVEYPGEPLMSETAIKMAAEIKAKKEAESGSATAILAPVEDPETSPLAFHNIFGLGKAPAARTRDGRPLLMQLMGGYASDEECYIPDVDQDHVFDIELTKRAIAAMRLKKNLYVWGYHGTGKTTLIEQIAARLKWPLLRVQHTVNTEESHIIGQWTAKNGSTEFSLGPLPYAMLKGLVYCADEYDFALPSVTSVYQAVMEGKPLIIKEAPPELRVIRPHENFRFCATGNTNGAGDDSGLYQGTQIMNAANFSRFGVTLEVGYMDANTEIAVVSGKCGIEKADAAKLVDVALSVREAFKSSTISMPISPRELINAGDYAVAFGGDWKLGFDVAYANRLSRVDREAVMTFMQRAFG